MALEAGADALGLVSAMPSGPGVIADSEIADIAAWVGERATTVLLTSRQSASSIAEQAGECRPDVIQLCDSVRETEMAQLRRYPHVSSLMPVIYVRNDDAVREAVQRSVHADAILLDSGDPTGADRTTQRFGQTRDSHRIARRSGIAAGQQA